MSGGQRVEPRSEPIDFLGCIEPEIFECTAADGEDICLPPDDFSVASPTTRSVSNSQVTTSTITALLRNVSLPLALFHQDNPTQQGTARALATFLEGIDFDGANRAAHAKEYGNTPIFDTDSTRAPESNTLSPRQRLALNFFMYGHSVSVDEMHTLFGEQTDLVGKLEDQGLLVVKMEGADVRYRLNDVSLTSHRLPNGQAMHLFVDLPARLSSDKGREPTAQLSATSYFLLHKLEADFRAGTAHAGTVADFGSGTGIQALALLKLYPGITDALAVEIDQHSINLSRLNAMMNGVEGRFAAVDNSNEKNFSTALAGRKLDYAVSNPPFNTVPKKYAAALTDFGDGGPHGLDVTEIFLRQALPAMKPGADFLLYSVLARNAGWDFFATDLLRSFHQGRGLSVQFEVLDMPEYELNRYRYAQALGGYIATHAHPGSPTSDFLHVLRLSASIETELEKDGVLDLSPTYWTVQNRGDSEPFHVATSDHRRFEPVRGGERIEMMRGGVYLMVHEVDMITPYLHGALAACSGKEGKDLLACFQEQMNSPAPKGKPRHRE